MNARSSWRSVLASIVLAGAAGLLTVQAVQAADQKKPEISDALKKTFQDAQKAMGEKKYQDVLTKMKEAEANPKKTPYDEHYINEFSFSANLQSGDRAAAEPYMEALVADSDIFTQADERQKLIKNLLIINYDLGKDDPSKYDKAIEYGNRAISGGDTSDDVMLRVAQAYFLKKDSANTAKFEEQWAQAKIQKGETPNSQQLQIWKTACVQLKDTDCVIRSLEAVVTYYPEPKSWEEALGELQTQVDPNNNRGQLQLYRLMLEVNVLQRSTEYTDAANLALEQGSPGEAQAIVQKGLDGQIFDAAHKDGAQKLLDSAKKRAAADRASLAEQEQDAAKAASGQPSAALGYAYFGYQQYDKAIQELSAGLAKGGVKDEAGSRLLLGISQLKAGHKDEAIQSFQQVKGSPVLVKLANFWVAHAKAPAGKS
jgi:hypothetical protein